MYTDCCLQWIQDIGFVIGLNYNNNMNQQQMTCCLCAAQFTANSNPRMMPNCPHNACTPCLKAFIKQPNHILHCQQCQSQQEILELDLEYFPKNITLTKQLKDSKSSPSLILSDFNIDSKQNKPEKDENEFCEVHKKDRQIICINDKIRLCPHCALFGNHKDHKIMTISEVNAAILQRQEAFQGFKSRKVELDAKMNSNEFKEAIIGKIGQQKEKLILSIKQKFNMLYQNIKLSQKKSYEDVIKNFKIIYSRITAFLKEQNEALRKYKEWQKKCSLLLEKSEKVDKIELKASLFINGPLEICSQGENLLNRLENKYESNMHVIENLISQIKIVESSSLANSIFNYVNVVIEDNHQIEELGIVQQEIVYTPKSKHQKIIVEFNSVNLDKDRQKTISPIKTKLSYSRDSEKNISAKSQQKSSNSKLSQEQLNNVEKLIEQFSQRQNIDTLDLTGYSLTDNEIYEILKFLKPIKKIKGLKLVKNKLTTEGLLRIIDLIPAVTNLNVSFNLLGDESVLVLLSNREKIPVLRIVNLSNNKINERKTKTAIEQLKRQGLIMTL